MSKKKLFLLLCSIIGLGLISYTSHRWKEQRDPLPKSTNIPGSGTLNHQTAKPHTLTNADRQVLASLLSNPIADPRDAVRVCVKTVRYGRHLAGERQIVEALMWP